MATSTRESRLPSDVSADATEAPWSHGSLKLRIGCQELRDLQKQGDDQEKEETLRGIFNALQKKSHGQTDPEVYNVDVSGDYVMIELVFRSRTTATDFVTGFFESCKPKSALQTHLAVRITSCDIFKAEKLITSSAGIDAAVSLIGTGSIPIAKGQGVADLCEKMANMNLKTCPSAEDIRDYDSLDQVITKEQHLEFGRLVGGERWKRVAQQLNALGCTFLTDAAIDTIEADNRGTEEQAYQMVRKYIDSEGSKATLARLVRAMDKCGYSKQATRLINT